MARTLLFLFSSKLKKNIYIYSEGLSDSSLRYFGVCHPLPPPLSYLLIVVLNIQQRSRPCHYSSCSLILYTIVLVHLYCSLPELFENSTLRGFSLGFCIMKGVGNTLGTSYWKWWTEATPTWEERGTWWDIHLAVNACIFSLLVLLRIHTRYLVLVLSSSVSAQGHSCRNPLSVYLYDCDM